MATSAAALNAQFIISTGDNFYWCGLENTTDFQVKTSWLDPYSDPALDLPWYVSLGNHEYGYNVSAQLGMAALYKNWILDSRYYTRRVQISTGVYISFIFLDSSPCVAEYRSTDSSGWDPCGTAYPTCSISGGSDSFEGTCRFHENIMTQDCSLQHTWFQRQLDAVPSEDWLIVVGHHAADEMDVEDFVTPMQSRHVDLYLNGHAHTLSQYTIDGSGAYVTTGAGAMVGTYGLAAATPPHNEGGSPAKDRTAARAEGLDTGSSFSHSYHTVWNQKVAGFTTHTFSGDYSQLTTSYVTASGTTPNSFTVSKGQLYKP